jgi:hypothetical protein
MLDIKKPMCRKHGTKGERGYIMAWKLCTRDGLDLWTAGSYGKRDLETHFENVPPKPVTLYVLRSKHGDHRHRIGDLYRLSDDFDFPHVYKKRPVCAEDWEVIELREVKET